MTISRKRSPVRATAFRLRSSKRARSPAASPARTLCLDIFSPAPGDSEVISQVERLSSNEMKIAPNCVRIAVGSSKRASTDIGRLQSEWVSNLSLDPEQAAIHPHGIFAAARNDGIGSTQEDGLELLDQRAATGLPT